MNLEEVNISAPNTNLSNLKTAGTVVINAENANLSGLETANMVAIYAANANLSGLETAGDIYIYTPPTLILVALKRLGMFLYTIMPQTQI